MDEYTNAYRSLALGMFVPIQCLATEICIAMQWRLPDPRAVLDILQSRADLWMAGYTLKLSEDEQWAEGQKISSKGIPARAFSTVMHVMSTHEPDFSRIGSRFDPSYLELLVQRACGVQTVPPFSPKETNAVPVTPVPRSSADWPFRRRGHLAKEWDELLLTYHERVKSSVKHDDLIRRFKQDYVPDAAIYRALGKTRYLFYRCISGKLDKQTKFYRTLREFLKKGELP
jgi:hypothetical protein